MEISTLLAVILPPKVACNPLADELPVDVILAPVIVTSPSLILFYDIIVATKAFAPVAAVEIVPSDIVNPPP